MPRISAHMGQFHKQCFPSCGEAESEWKSFLLVKCCLLRWLTLSLARGFVELSNINLLCGWNGTCSATIRSLSFYFWCHAFCLVTVPYWVVYCYPACTSLADWRQWRQIVLHFPRYLGLRNPKAEHISCKHDGLLSIKKRHTLIHFQ